MVDVDGWDDFGGISFGVSPIYVMGPPNLACVTAMGVCAML